MWYGNIAGGFFVVVVLYSFLIAGHTKFSPDWCFGLLKQSFRLPQLMEEDDDSLAVAYFQFVEQSSIISLDNNI